MYEAAKNRCQYCHIARLLPHPDHIASWLVELVCHRIGFVTVLKEQQHMAGTARACWWECTGSHGFARPSDVPGP